MNVNMFTIKSIKANRQLHHKINIYNIYIYKSPQRSYGKNGCITNQNKVDNANDTSNSKEST